MALDNKSGMKKAELKGELGLSHDAVRRSLHRASIAMQLKAPRRKIIRVTPISKPTTSPSTDTTTFRCKIVACGQFLAPRVQ